MPPTNKPGPLGKNVGSKTLPMPKVGAVSPGDTTVASQTVTAGGAKSQKTSEERAKSLRLPVLRMGCLGPQVQKLQRLLNVRISPSPQLALDGDFGPLTFAAVVNYQRGVSITQDGIVGPQTWHRLLKGEQALALKAAAPMVQSPAATPAKPVVKAVVSPVVKDAIWEWTLEQKFREVVSRIPKRFTGQARREFEAMMQAENLALALVFIAGFMLLSGGTAAIVGWIIFGVDATTSLILALQTTYLAATEEELDEAADEFSHVILSVSIAAFFRGIKSIKQKIKTNASPANPQKPQKPAPVEPAKPKAQPAPKPLGPNPLSPAQQSALTKFNKKLPSGAQPTKVYDLPNGGKAFQAEVPGKVPGSKAVYEKQIDSSGKTTTYTKTTYAPDGSLVHVKTKFPEGQEPIYGPGYKEPPK